MSIQQRVFNQLRDLRILEYFLKSDAFTDAEKMATPDQSVMIKALLEGILRGHDELRTQMMADLKALCERISNRDITLVALREKASRLCIRYYTRLSREELIEAINKRLYYDPKNLGHDHGNQGHVAGSGPEPRPDSIHQIPIGEGDSGILTPRTGVADRIS